MFGVWSLGFGVAESGKSLPGYLTVLFGELFPNFLIPYS
jgi:hypothetical protein